MRNNLKRIEEIYDWSMFGHFFEESSKKMYQLIWIKTNRRIRCEMFINKNFEELFNITR